MMNIKGIFILSLFWCGLNTSVYSGVANKETLPQKCMHLSQDVYALILNQDKKSCIEKLTQASTQIDQAAEWIAEEIYTTAKSELSKAVYLLQFAELNNCHRYIQITHAKFETQKIKRKLLELSSH